MRRTTAGRSFVVGQRGGGMSVYENEPMYFAEQFGVLNDAAGYRAVPDVSYNANPGTGYAVYNSIPYQNAAGWFQVGGTSAATPQWAAGDRELDARSVGQVAALELELDALPEQRARRCSEFLPREQHAHLPARLPRGGGIRPVHGLGSPQAKNLIPSLAVRDLSGSTCGRRGLPRQAPFFSHTTRTVSNLGRPSYLGGACAEQTAQSARKSTAIATVLRKDSHTMRGANLALNRYQ